MKTRSQERQSALRAVSNSGGNRATTKADCKSAAGCNPALHLASTKSITCTWVSRECERGTQEGVRHSLLLRFGSVEADFFQGFVDGGEDARFYAGGEWAGLAVVDHVVHGFVAAFTQDALRRDVTHH